MAEETVPCARCGELNDSSASFCVHCGTPAQTPPPDPYGSSQATQQSPPPDPSGPSQATQQSPPPPRPPATPSYVLGEHPQSLTQRGVLTSLFDVSFTSLVGTKLVRVIYVLALIWVGLTALSYVVFAFHLSGAIGLVVLFVLAPLSSLFVLGFIRIALELYIGLFQVVANSNELVAQGRRDSQARTGAAGR